MTEDKSTNLYPRRIYVPMDGELWDALFKEAKKDYRYPNMEAAILIREALIARGVLKDEDGR